MIFQNMFLQKYIFYGYEASVMAFISLILRKTSEKLCLPLCHKSLQEKGQEIGESICAKITLFT